MTEVRYKIFHSNKDGKDYLFLPDSNQYYVMIEPSYRHPYNYPSVAVVGIHFGNYYWHEIDPRLFPEDIINEIIITKKEYKIMPSLSEKFIIAMTKEPKKSFRELGITDGDDFITTDGQKIFLTYLLNKFQEDFKKVVVDEILRKDKEVEEDNEKK